MGRRTIARKLWPTYLPSQLTPFKLGQGFNAFIKERCQQSFIAYLRFDLWGVLLVDQKKAKYCTTLISSVNEKPSGEILPSFYRETGSGFVAAGRKAAAAAGGRKRQI